MNSSNNQKPGKNKEKAISLHRALLNLNKAKTYSELQESIREIAKEELNFKEAILWLEDRKKLRKIISEPEEGQKAQKPAQKAFNENKIIIEDSSKNKDVFLPLENYGLLELKEGKAPRELLGMIKDTVLFTIKSLKQENQGLDGTELHFTSENSELFPATIAQQTGAECSIDDVLPNSNGGEIYYLNIDDLRSEKISQRVEELQNIKKCKVLESRGSDTTLKAKTSQKTFFSSLIEFKASIEKIKAQPDKIKIILWSSNDMDTIDIFEEFRKAKGDWEVIKKRNRKRDKKADRQSEKIEELLTEKQLEALKQAYRSGYYEYPRECSAKEVASSLEITDSTLFQHLQAAQKKIISQSLDFSDQRY